MDSLIEQLHHFKPISLEQMQSVKLMNRIDTKFLASIEQLDDMLNRLKSNYYVQLTAQQPLAHYRTLYYDTPDAAMYLAHHDRKLTRQKLRARIYCNTLDAFCEIKNKNNKLRTKKKRVPLPISDFDKMLENSEIRDFVAPKLNYDPRNLSPHVENEFDRITLVNYDKTERLTIDSRISFRNHRTGKSASLPQLVVIELKQDGNVPSFFKRVIRDLRIKPKRISKYCLGTTLTNPDIKQNRFKQKLRYIRKLVGNDFGLVASDRLNE